MTNNRETKVVAFDVLGTILPTFGENIPRQGTLNLLKKLTKAKIPVCTCSDANTSDIRKYLKEAKIDLNYFDLFFQMPRQPGEFTRQPKDIKRILKYYNEQMNIAPRELLVIGDRQERDIEPARELGCHTILVPEYYSDTEADDYDISKIRIP